MVRRGRRVDAAPAAHQRHPLAHLRERSGVPELAQANLLEADAGEECEHTDEMEEERDGVCGHEITREMG